VDKNGDVPEHPNQRMYDRETGRLVQDGLTQLVKMFPPTKVPTPDASMSSGGPQDPAIRKAGGHSVGLHDVVCKGGKAERVPTPSSQKIALSGELTNADGTPWDGESKPHSATTGLPVQTALTDTVKARGEKMPTPHGFSKDGLSNGPSGNELGRAVNQSVKCPSPRASEAAHPGRVSTNHDGQVGLAEFANQVPAEGSLNPNWVEWLMNWPVGMTSLTPMPLELFEFWVQRTNAGEWWHEEPEGIPRVAKGVKDRTNRLKAIGNGQVPLAAAMAWSLLMERLDERR